MAVGFCYLKWAALPCLVVEESREGKHDGGPESEAGESEEACWGAEESEEM